MFEATGFGFKVRNMKLCKAQSAMRFWHLLIWQPPGAGKAQEWDGR